MTIRDTIVGALPEDQPSRAIEASFLRGVLLSMVDAADARAVWYARTIATSPRALTGLAAVNGVALAEGDTVALSAQADETENGLWTASAGAWSRLAGADRPGAVVTGAPVYIREGGAAGTQYTFSFSDAQFLPGSTAVTIAARGTAGAPSGAAGGDLGGSYPNPTVASIGSVIIVRDVDDLPAAVGGVRTLVSGTTYFLAASVDLGTDTLTTTVGGLAIIIGPSRFAVTLSTNNANALFGLTGGIYTQDIRLVNTGGPVFTVTGSAGRAANVERCIVVNAAQDTFTGVAGSTTCLMRLVGYIGSAQGVQVTGIWAAVRLDTVAHFSSGPTCVMIQIPAGLTAGVFSVRGGDFISTGAGQTIFDFDSGATIATLAYVEGNLLSGPATAFGGDVTPLTSGWWFQNNGGIADSAAIGGMFYNENVLATVIALVNGWTAIAHTPAWTIDANAQRFSVDGEALQYDGVEVREFVVTMNAAILGASPNKSFQLRALRNGTAIASSLLHVDFKTDLVAGSRTFLVQLATTDVLTFEIRNITDAADVIVEDFNVTAFSVT